MEKFRDLYRIPSARATWWDYSANGCYFITICTANRECLLGHIMEDSKMQLSFIGQIVEKEWVKSYEIRNELHCDAFVIMPNHVHAILWIDNDFPAVEAHGVRLSKSHPVSRPPKSISSFMAGFKSSVTKRVNEYYNISGVRHTVWQTRFHDRIIRNQDEYQRILNYIYDNPAKWPEDKFYVPL